MPYSQIPAELITLIAKEVRSSRFFDGEAGVSVPRWGWQDLRLPSYLLRFALVDKRTSQIVLPTLYEHLVLDSHNFAKVLSALRTRRVTCPQQSYRVDSICCRDSWYRKRREAYPTHIEETLQSIRSSTEDDPIGWTLARESEWADGYSYTVGWRPEDELREFIFVSTIIRDIIQEAASTVRAVAADFSTLLCWRWFDTLPNDHLLQHLEHVTISNKEFLTEAHAEGGQFRALQFAVIDALDQFGSLPSLRSINLTFSKRSDQSSTDPFTASIAERPHWKNLARPSLNIPAEDPGNNGDLVTQQTETFLYALPNLVELSITFYAFTPSCLARSTLLAKNYPFRTNLRSLCIGAVIDETITPLSVFEALKPFLSVISRYSTLERLVFLPGILHYARLPSFRIFYSDECLADENLAHEELLSTIPFPAGLKAWGIQLADKSEAPLLNEDLDRMLDALTQIVQSPTFPRSAKLDLGHGWDTAAAELLEGDTDENVHDFIEAAKALKAVCKAKKVDWHTTSDWLAQVVQDADREEASPA